jgi:hypothetical protein
MISRAIYAYGGRLRIQLKTGFRPPPYLPEAGYHLRGTFGMLNRISGAGGACIIHQKQPEGVCFKLVTHLLLCDRRNISSFWPLVNSLTRRTTVLDATFFSGATFNTRAAHGCGFNSAYQTIFRFETNLRILESAASWMVKVDR